MRFERFITSGREEPIRMALEQHTGPGVVIAGVAPGSAAALSLAERYEARGYVAAVADVGHDVAQGLAAVRAAMDAVAARPGWNGKTAVAGYGVGGRFAYLAVTRLGADGAVIFHGTNVGRHLDEAARARKPMSLHFGDADERVPFAEVRAIKGALEGFGTIEIYRYPDAREDFALPGSATYDRAAAERAEARAFEVLDGLR